MTWGVQGYLQTNVFGKLPYKTSPSGGARHPVEVCLDGPQGEGSQQGDLPLPGQGPSPGKNTPGKASARLASEYCAGQPSFGEAAALFIMTAVFARTMWKYGRGFGLPGWFC